MLKPSTLLIAVLDAIICATVFFGVRAPALAQSDYGRITVTVTPRREDVQIGLVGPQGKVPICTTGPEGKCIFSGLAPGTYKIYAPGAADPITVTLFLGQNVTRDVQVSDDQISAAAAQPAMPADARVSQAEGEQAEQQASLTERIIPGRTGDRAMSSELKQLPNRDQSEVPLLQQQPGAVSTGVDAFAGFIFNGLSATQNVLRDSGVSSNPIVLSSASFQDPNALFADIGDRQSIKAYKTFAIDTSNTPAEFGTGTGGQLISEIKSGEEAFNAEIYEYHANDIFGARNFFDFARKPSLRFNLFGTNVSGELRKGLFGFFNYEGIRGSSGNTLFAAAPKLSLATTADPAVAGLLRSFRANGAAIVQGASEDDNFDIIQLEAKNRAESDSVTTRIDYKLNKEDEISGIFRGSRTRVNLPDGASGRRSISSASSYKGVFRYLAAIRSGQTGGTRLTNEFIFGINHTPSRLSARSEDNIGPELFNSAINMGGKINQTGIAGQPLPLSVPTSGGLLGGDFNGRFLTVKPWQFSFVDQMELTHGGHVVTFGGEVRLLRTSLDQLFGTTYKFSNLTDFLANHAAVEHSGDLGSLTASPGPRRVSQTYYIGYVQDAWRMSETTSLTYGLRYEYYTRLRELNQSLVNIDPATGDLVPATEDLYKSRKTNFLPRIAFAWAPLWHTPHEKDSALKYAPTLISASFGMHVGPDVFENILRPVTNNRLALAGENLAFPVDPRILEAASPTDDRRLKPLALSRDYTSPARVYKFDFTLKQALVDRNPLISAEPDRNKVLQELYVSLSYIGNRGHGLLLRNFANPIVSVQTNPDPTKGAIIKRQFDTEVDGQPRHPFGEFEFLTTGGRSSYDSFQVVLNGRLKQLKLLQVNYTLAQSRGNTDDADAIGAGNPLDYNYDMGYNLADVRHQFKFSTVLDIPCLIPKACPKTGVVKKALGNWQLATIGFFQSGAPIDVRIDRPDVVYVDQAGKVFNGPAIGRTAVLNTPGGGSSVAAYRPNVVGGANPYLGNDRNYLNPAAFSIPAPGTLGNLTRGALRGPRVRFVDFSLRKEIKFGPEENLKTLAFNVDVTNIFNFTNFRLTKATLPDKLGTGDSELQPNNAYTQAMAPDFGVITRTFKRQSDLGASRQIQFGISLNFDRP